MASAEQLPSGNWRGVYRDAAGNKQRVKGTFPRKRDAREAAQQAEVEAKRQAAVKSGNGKKLSPAMTWGDWCRAWWPHRSIEPNTEYTERRMCEKYLIPYWGEVPLNQISQSDIQAWVDRTLQKTLTTASYLRRVYAVFSASMFAAVGEQGPLEANPCVSIKLPRQPKTRRRHLEDKAFEKLLSGMSHKRYKEAVEFLRETGLRPNELAGLHRDHVERESGWLIVAQVYDRIGKMIKPFPKDDDVRGVPLTPRALEILDTWEREIPARKGCGIMHKDGRRCQSDLAFRQLNGNVLNPNNFLKIVTYAAEKAKLPPGTSPYVMRHTYGTRLANAGLDPFEIARLMGHATLEQSMDYVHRSEAARQRILAALGDENAARLRVVGRADERGTRRGTDSLPPSSDHNHSEPEAKGG